MNLSTKNTDGTWTAGIEYYYIRNAQGDIIGLYDGNGSQVASYSYDSWGKLISIKDGSDNDITNDTTSVGYKNPFRYRGYRYDTETELYYLQSRYYSPEWGRYLNADSTGGKVGTVLSHNMFSYCFNSPINLEDPSGQWPTLGQIFKAAAIVAATVVTVAVVVGSAPIVASMAGIAAGMYIGAGAMSVAATIVTVVAGAVAVGVAVTGANRAVETLSGKNYGASLLGEKTYNKIETVVNVAAITIGSSSQYGSYPSTGRTKASNLKEQMALDAAIKNPGKGEVIIPYLNDKRFPGWMGWQKYSMTAYAKSGNIQIHYVGNRIIPIFFDYKIK